MVMVGYIVQSIRSITVRQWSMVRFFIPCFIGAIMNGEDLDTDEALRRFESQLSENIENATHKT